VETFLRVLPTRWRRKPAGIDMERNYVIVTLCIRFTVIIYLRELSLNTNYVLCFAFLYVCLLVCCACQLMMMMMMMMTMIQNVNQRRSSQTEMRHVHLMHLLPLATIVCETVTRSIESSVMVSLFGTHCEIFFVTLSI